MTGEPRSLSELISWYRDELSDALPTRLHSRDLDMAGNPEWHGKFREWLTAHPGAEDREGELLAPLRYWLWRMEEKDEDGAMFLMLLPAFDWDWRMAQSSAAAAKGRHISPVGALRALFRRMYSVNRDAQGNVVITPNIPRRPARGDCEERGCGNQTTRRFCRDHEKSDAQLDAEAAA